MLIRLTQGQLLALRAVWPRLLKQPPPNCTQLLRVAGFSWDGPQLIGFLNRLAKKGVLRHWLGPRNQRLWAPGPMSDYLQEEGLLP